MIDVVSNAANNIDSGDIIDQIPLNSIVTKEDTEDNLDLVDVY